MRKLSILVPFALLLLPVSALAQADPEPTANDDVGTNVPWQAQIYSSATDWTPEHEPLNYD